jgi:hypothetical protein
VVPRAVYREASLRRRSAVTVWLPAPVGRLSVPERRALPRWAAEWPESSPARSEPETAAGRAQATPARTLEFKGIGDLALTDIEPRTGPAKTCLLRLTRAEALVRIPRNDVASAELEQGLAPPLNITLASGQVWYFEIPNSGVLPVVLRYRHQARAVAYALRGAVARA